MERHFLSCCEVTRTVGDGVAELSCGGCGALVTGADAEVLAAGGSAPGAGILGT